MQNRAKMFVVFVSAVVMMALTGCSSIIPPTNWHTPKPEDLERHPYGAFVRVMYDSVKEEGEFIGIRDSSVVISMPGRVRLIPLNVIRYAGLKFHQNDVPTSFIGTVGLVPLAFIANGVVGVITAPIGVIVGAAATADENSRGQVGSGSNGQVVEYKWWVVNQKYARFPQGVPMNVKLDDLAYPVTQ